MSTTKHLHAKANAIVAILFLLPALLFFMLWSSIGLQASALNAREKISYYLDKFPSFMQSLTMINIISMVCCVVSIYFASRSFTKRLVSVRVLMMVDVLVALFIILFDIYQLV